MSTKLKWLIVVGVFALVGGIALIVGYYLAGADIIGWFTTKWAFIVYFFAGVYMLVLGGVLVNDYVMRK